MGGRPDADAVLIMARSQSLPAKEVKAAVVEISRYCRRTKMTTAMLGDLALRQGGFFALLKLRGTLTAETAERVRAFMARWPNGTTRAEVREAAIEDAKAKADWTNAVSLAVAPGTAIAASEPAATMVDQVQAEAAVAGERRRAARSMGIQRPLAVERPARQGAIVAALIDDPSDLVATVRRRWPDLWNELKARAQAANVSPVQQLFDVIETGLAA